MIDTFVLCKSDLFFKAIEKELNKHHISCKNIFKDPETAFEAYEQIASKPDIIILDANWRKHMIADATIIKRFNAIADRPKIILVTNYYDEQIATKLRDLRVNGYFYRNVEDVSPIVDCIKQVYKGKLSTAPKPMTEQ